MSIARMGKSRSSPKQLARSTPGSTDHKDDPTDRLGVTLSGLLNVLDGFHAPEYVLFIMTSNQIVALDPALLPPGRIDYRLYMGKASDQQKVGLYRRFFPKGSQREARDFVEAHSQAETMAEFQGLLLSLEEQQTRLTRVELELGRTGQAGTPIAPSL
jgi:chaperone BCS1